MGNSLLSGFNTTLQQVDERYVWINDMIKARQDLVVMFIKLLELPVNGQGPDGNEYPQYDEIVKFCDSLIDYVSHGHFDLYPKILELMEHASGRSLSIANRAMPRIEKTSDYLMRFNDRYCEDLNPEKLLTLKDDLANVAKCLEVRFRHEDRLIIGLRLVHTIVESASS